MAERPYLWQRLLGKKPEHKQPVSMQIGDMMLVPAGQSVERAERALPGTASLPLVLQLVPPPVDPDLVDPPDPGGKRDYGPDPVAEWSLTFEAGKAFDCATMAKWLHARHDLFARPTHFVRTPGGQITYLASSDSPSRGVALVTAWSLAAWTNPETAKILGGATALKAALADLPARFAAPRIRPEDLKKQLAQVARIEAIRPRTVIMTVYHPEGEFHDGRTVWTLLHQPGLRWGDMDSFQWIDPTRQTDYLIWAEVDDGELGYALPERIAAGTQHFRAIRFSFDIARSPAPVHVLGQLERLVAAARSALPFDKAAFLDAVQVSGVDDLRIGVDRVVSDLGSLGLKPGGGSVSRLL